MPILGPDGNPIHGSDPPSGVVSLNPIDQIPAIPDEALAAVLQQCRGALQAGAPVSAQVRVDLGLLASLARTIRDQRVALRATASPEPAETPLPEISPDRNGLVMPPFEE